MNEYGPLFTDRAEAGRQLADRLASYRGMPAVVLALPRGGVPVAYEIAEALKAPLDVILVRKIGVPWQPELAMAAVAEGEPPEIAINSEIVAELSITSDQVRKEARRQLVEIERRRMLYRAGRPPVPLAGRTAIVVDDGIATGATVEAALRAARRRGPRELVLAVPVAPHDSLARLEASVDAIVCLSTPALFDAVGSFYRHFPQVSDDEVIDLLARGRPATSNERRREASPSH